eukprot:5120994-Amphidinium_carterae.1
MHTNCPSVGMHCGRKPSVRLHVTKDMGSEDAGLAEPTIKRAPATDSNRCDEQRGAFDAGWPAPQPPSKALFYKNAYKLSIGDQCPKEQIAQIKRSTPKEQREKPDTKKTSIQESFGPAGDQKRWDGIASVNGK